MATWTITPQSVDDARRTPRNSTSSAIRLKGRCNAHLQYAICARKLEVIWPRGTAVGGIGAVVIFSQSLHTLVSRVVWST